jgi:hypothetical protein
VKKVLSILFFLSIEIHAQYRYVIYTDQNPPVRANEVISLFQNTEPFNEFEVEYVVRQMPTDDLGCTRPYPEVERVIECDTRHILMSAQEAGFDQAMVISDSDTYGGAAGTIPVMSSVTPPETMVHEYLHVLGFCDEYHYTTRDEADLYCSNPRFFDRYLNAVIIEPIEGGYTGDEHARSEHSGDIPWYSHIHAETPIASSTLGTPSSKSNPNHGEVGLFETGVCDNASIQLSLWKPGGQPNIMEDINLPIGTYVPLVREALASVIANSEIVPDSSGKGKTTNCSIEETQPLNEEEISFIETVARELED